MIKRSENTSCILGYDQATATVLNRYPLKGKRPISAILELESKNLIVI